MIRRTESHFEGAQGHEIFERCWTPQEARHSIVLVHGYAEHSARYEPFGAWFAARGCAVRAFDQQGHGRSSGTRCHVRRFGDFLDDVDVVLARAREEHPGLPQALVGHSMGGLIVATYLCEREPELACAATSGALLALGDEISRPKVVGARALRFLLPRLSMDSGIDAAGLSRDEKVIADYLADPLIPRKLTASLAAELFSTVGRTATRAAEVRVPLLMLHGEADPICPVAGTRAFYDAMTLDRKALRTYPELLHEIFNEPEHETVFADLLSWVQSHEQAPAGSASGSPGAQAAAVTP